MVSAKVSEQNQALLTLLDNHPVTFIRLLWLDYVSVLRNRVLTVRHFRSLAEREHHHGLCGLNLFLQDTDSDDDTPASSVGQSLLVPDTSSFRIWPNAPTHASVFCYFLDRVDELSPLQIQTPSACPRQTLQRALKEASVLNLGFLVGFEIEFVCSPWDNQHNVVHRTTGARTLEAFMMPILCEVVQVLEQSNIPVEHFHAEGAENQFEIATSPLDPFNAVDALVITRETIWLVCRKHRVDVSFSPAVPETNGTHLNISLTGQKTASRADNFLAGILDHIDSLCALGLPHPESYHRTAPKGVGAGRYKAWGTQNREVAIRKKGPAFWEVRFHDASSNTYLFLAALIFAGVAGVRCQTPLTLPDLQVDPARISEDARKMLGIVEQIPANPEEAYKALEHDELLRERLGMEVISNFLFVMQGYQQRLIASGLIGSAVRHRWLSSRL